MTVVREPRALATALFARPSPPFDAVVRRSVLEQLDAGPGRVAVVTAPAGYGKTTHLAVWAERVAHPLAWLDLDASLNDPNLLLSALTDALSAVTDFDASSIGLRRPTSGQITTVVAPRFRQALGRCTTPFVLVLDDVHTIDTPQSLDLLDVLVAHAPYGARIVLAGSSVPLPSLARLRVDPGLTELGIENLAFGTLEAGALLEELGVAVDDEVLAALVEATDGWPVGIRLTASSIEDDLVSHSPRSRAQRSDHRVAEYVRSEWLGGMSPDDVAFLSSVSVLDRLNGPLCDHVLSVEGSGEVLRRIHSSRHLVIPLDRRHESYRMNHLLRDVLRADLERRDPSALQHLHQRACTWFEWVGDIDRAMHHAVQAGDFAHAERLVTDHAAALQTGGRFTTLTRWLELFPPERVRTSASLCLAAAVAALGGDGRAVQAWTLLGIRTACSPAHEPSDPEVLLKLYAFNAAVCVGPVRPVLEPAERAYRELSPGVWHAVACEGYGAQLFSIGDDELATRILTEGAAEARIFGARTIEALCLAQLAVIAHHAGESERASRIALDARKGLREGGLDHWPTVALVVAMGALAEALSGDPQAANDDLNLSRTSLANLEGVGAWAHAQARLALAETSLLLADRVGARVLLKETAALLASQPDAFRPHRQLEALERRLAASHPLMPVGPSSLSTAELRVLHYLPTNLTIGEIGERLYVSRHTTKSHVAAIYRKLGTSSRQATVEFAREVGLLPAVGQP